MVNKMPSSLTSLMVVILVGCLLYTEAEVDRASEVIQDDKDSGIENEPGDNILPIHHQEAPDVMEEEVDHTTDDDKDKDEKAPDDSDVIVEEIDKEEKKTEDTNPPTDNNDCEKKVSTGEEISTEDNNIDDLSDTVNTKVERKKRLAITDSSHKWPKAIIPYKFTSSINDDRKHDIRAVFSFYERNTCVKYVKEADAAQYDLGHSGCLKFKTESGCYSMLGNTRKTQTISCCGRTLCIHENAHAIGLLHEQQNKDRQGFIRIEWDNIKASSISNFVEKTSDVTHTHYDFSSMMHYSLFTFSKNKKQTITELIEAPDFILGGKYYYLLQQVSDALGCMAVGNCDDVPCENDGYVTVKRGKCACVCPHGLEPSTGCTTPKANARGIDWPPGKFAVLKSAASCPSGFTEGSVTLQGSGDNEAPDNGHLQGDFNKKTHEYHFCVQDESSESEAKWEPGNYCINKQGDSCPEGFNPDSGSITVTGLKGGANSGVLPSGSFGNDVVTFDYCCRSDGITFDPIILPSDTAFSMYPQYTQCQEVEGMYSRREYYVIDGVTATQKGAVPAHSATNNQLELPVCYYMPIQYGCGGVVDLTSDAPSHEFSSPMDADGKMYPNGVECVWLFKGPTESKLSLAFEEFDIHESSNGCTDYVETRTMMIGQPGPRFCGPRLNRNVLSQWNTLMIILRTDTEGQGKGFKAKVTMRPWTDLSFSIEDRGESYNGKINYTSSSEPCLNWREMTMCRHYSTNPEDLGDRLEDNYCRNPGHGFQPWCYIKKDGCKRNYCDVSGLGGLFDSSPDCVSTLSDDPEMCSDELLAMSCMRTCESNLNLHSPTPMKNCGKPGTIPDAELISPKDSYDIGEKASFACSSDATTTLDVTCLTDGTWSPGGYVCGDCPSGWYPYGGHCYKYFSTKMAYPEAQAECKKNSGDITSILSQEEQNFVASLKQAEDITWISLTKVDGAWKWEGVTPLSYRNWADGEPWSVKGSKKWIKHAYMLGVDKEYKWTPTGAWKKWPLEAFICKSKPSSARSTCADRRTDCVHEISEMSTICENHAEFAWQQCPKSCGVCDADSAGTCDVPADGDHVIRVTGGATLNQGESVTYTCEEDFGLSTGNLERACVDGQLTGSEPVCIDVNQITSLTSSVDIISRNYVPGNFRIYIGSGDEFKITRSGEITRFEYYSLYQGAALLQVYRPTEDPMRMTLIANYPVTTRIGQPMVFHVPKDNRVQVQADDRLAIWYDEERAGICYDSCTDDSKQGLESDDYIYWPSNFETNVVYDFIVSARCQTFSFRAVVAPIS